MRHIASRAAPLLCFCLLISASSCFKSACASGRHTEAYEISPSSSGSVSEGDEQAPSGFVRMEVMGVLPTAEGNAVFLGDRDNQTVVPIWIGAAEAMSIQLRMERRRFERPLTHDLLDAMVKELGGQILRVHVDDLKGSTFVATVVVRAGDRVISMDARPSDAIAVAVGNRVPIYVAIDVVDRTGLGQEDLPEEPFEVPSLEDVLPEGHHLRDREEPGIIGPPPTQSL